MVDFLQNVKEILFAVDLVILYVLLIGIGWSVAFPNRRVWPPPKKWSWQYTLTWVLFYIAFILNGFLVLIDWNSWLFTYNSRFFLGIPIVVIGSLLFSWGLASLGTKNTSGLKERFIIKGPYKFTRNPQYLGDLILFAGIILISNSFYVLITHVLLILVFSITPLAEEVWLEETYGEDYKKYKKITPRFL